MTLQDFAFLLHKAKPTRIKGVEGYRACCPAHDDASPSFAVWEGADGYLHVKCQRGCTEDQILASLGLAQEDRRVKEPIPVSSPGTETVYVYTSEVGEYLFEKYRPAKPKPNGPKLSQRTKDAAGSYVYSLESIGDKHKTLYRISEVTSAVASGRTIWINEGEKAVEAFRIKREVATCQPAGAGPGKWLSKYSQVLTGADVVIVADRDSVGEEYAGEVAVSLLDLAKSVRIVQSKTEGEHDDAYDHFMAGGTLEDFVERSDLIKMSMPGLVTDIDWDNFAPIEVEYLWEPYLWLGQTCLFSADSGIGKSTFAIGVAAGLSIGAVPNGEGDCEPVSTLYCIGDADRWQAYLTLYQAMGGKMAKDWFAPLQGTRPVEQLCREIKFWCKTHPKCKFIVVDPLVNFAAATNSKADLNAGIDMVGILGHLADLASEINVVIFVLHHDSKLGTDFMGSVMIKARARGYLHAMWHPDEKGLVVVEDRKGSLMVQRGEPFAFKRSGRLGTVEYIKDFEMPADPNSRKRPGPKTDAVESAKDALVQVLLRGPVHYDVARKQVMSLCGCSMATVYRAAARLKIPTTKSGVDTWSLPADLDPFADEAPELGHVYRGGD